MLIPIQNLGRVTPAYNPRSGYSARAVLLVLCLLITSCSDHPTPSVRTEGWREGDGWVETRRHAKGDAIYTRFDRGTEHRWFETRNLRTRYMLRDEVVP